MRDAIDVVILTYRPDAKLCDIVDSLEGQSVPPGRIIIMNTGQDIFEAFLTGHPGRLDGYTNIEVHHIPESEFDHGGTRKRAAGYSDAAFLVYMTQDAMPASEHLLAALREPFDNDDSIAVSYARQIPYDSASPIECYNRSFNYPAEDRKKTAADIPVLGIKAFFCSDVCACYRREIYDRLGGHIEHTVFNEDMIYARTALEAGYAVYYAAKAEVYHSHDYSPAEQYRRNIGLGRSQAEHPEVFGDVSSTGEGKKLVKGCISYLISNGYWYLVPEFILQCAGRYLGYRKGKKYVRNSRLHRA
ncbi:MAG: glycosyltransferase [Lachnospiraceae bacterium]|nr:glycosyltransferase [Lachnospiraceae bacterium]